MANSTSVWELGFLILRISASGKRAIALAVQAVDREMMENRSSVSSHTRSIACSWNRGGVGHQSLLTVSAPEEMMFSTSMPTFTAPAAAY